MSWLDLAAGAGKGLDKILADRLAQENWERKQAEEERANVATETYRTQSLESASADRQLARDQAKAIADQAHQDRLRDDARALGQQIPPGTEFSPVRWTSLVEQGVFPEERAKKFVPYDENFVGPLQPEGPQRGEPIATLQPTPEQANQIAQRAQAEKNAEAAARNAEMAAHSPIWKEWQDHVAAGGTLSFDEFRKQDANLRNPPPARASLQIVMTKDGPVVVDKTSRTASPVTAADTGERLPLPPTVDTRNREAAMQRVKPMLDAINELSPVINTKPGIQAIFNGGWRTVKAKAQEDDDVAEYVAVVEAFTPLLARAEGHTGVLTEQDFEHSMAILPMPTNSASLAKRKIARLEKILGIQPGNQNQPGSQGPPATRKYNPATGKAE